MKSFNVTREFCVEVDFFERISERKKVDTERDKIISKDAVDQLKIILRLATRIKVKKF